MPNRNHPDDEQVHLVTSARTAHSQEMHLRKRRYLISMGIRTACLVLAIFVFRGWLRLIGIAAALILPWLAVVLANAGPVPGDQDPEFVEQGPPQLGRGADTEITTGERPR